LPCCRGNHPHRRLLPSAQRRRTRAAHSFWRRFAEIENVVAIKIAPFNRYQTLDVIAP
jgi:phytoene/squalene synthetase